VTQIGEILDAGLVPLLVGVLRTGEFRAQKEVVWAITNITSGGNVDHMIFLCQNGAVPAMCQMLKCRDWRTILTTLDGLENILKAAEEVGQVEKVACAIEECGGLDLIEQLQNHENNEVYNKVFSIIDLFFSEENADDDNLLPSTNAEGDFQMSVSNNIPDGGFNI
jgi:importin subunit alpha-2